MSRDRIDDLRRRTRAILDTALELEQAYPGGEAMPPEKQAEVDALLGLLDRLHEEERRLEAAWEKGLIACPGPLLTAEQEYRIRLGRIADRDRAITPALIETWTRAFGSERAPEMFWAMKDGC